MNLSPNEHISGVTRDFMGTMDIGVAAAHPDIQAMARFGRAKDTKGAMELIRNRDSSIPLSLLLNAYTTGSANFKISM